MVCFAERMGLRPARTLVQRNSLDDDTRTELWNITLGLMKALGEKQAYESNTVLQIVTSAIWAWEFKKPRDEEPADGRVWGQLKRMSLLPIGSTCSTSSKQ